MATHNASTASHIVRSSPGTVSVDLTGLLDDNQSITLQLDGKILLGGYSQHLEYGYQGAPGEESYAYDLDHSVVRLNADGSLDTSFAQGGVDIVPAGLLPDWMDETMTVQANGKVLAATAVDDGLRVQRFNSDGTLDTTFGTGGAIIVNVTHDYRGVEVTANTDGTLYISARGTSQATVTKVDSNGALIGGFGDNGALILDVVDSAHAIGDISTHVQADGSVLLGSIYEVQTPTVPPSGNVQVTQVYTLQHFTPDGELDTRFGDNGILYFDPALGLRSDSAVTMQADGKIIVVGHSLSDPFGVVIRLNADGSYDSSFGTGGKVTFDSDTAASVAVLPDGKILVAGLRDGDFGITRFNADGSVDTSFGSPDGKHHVDGYNGEDILRGTGAAEIIHGLAGDDVLQGNGGRDVLLGGDGADIFRFTHVSDSYRTATQNGSDRIQDFDASHDRIDLIGLGFTGIGDGHHGTLAVQTSADGTRTYLKSFDADASGQRFELVFDGNLAGQLNSTNVVFTAPTVEGTAGRDVIAGSALSEIIFGGAGNDRINGGAGADVLIGGAGADVLNGGDRADISLRTDHENGDIFRYTSTDDSYRTDSQSFVDLIVNFATHSDKLDISALGYTGFGDGTGTTLKVAYNRELDRTYLKDLDADAQGHRFEIALTGNWVGEFADNDVVFAPAVDVSLVGVATADPDHPVV
ncbi:calcium-binding protein [Pseudomonas sp. RIT-PI-S]|uniref:calcium-binding protein n=1 Tax=Pseudomonas sp. RIT-PI-S TaxID=3035295 RepID=UPI0021D848BD|nr:calcium-binding protein [Pseudomonas sp. RIT-PI-S]